MRALSTPRGFSVWLHKLHLPEAAVAPVPLQGDVSLNEGEQKRRATLRDLLQKAVQGQELSAEAASRSLARYSAGEELLLSATHIDWLTPMGHPKPLIPLLLSDVLYEPVRKRLAFGRTEFASHVVLLAPRGETESRDVWLLCVGRCTESELTHFLFGLSRRGALRWDVKHCYSIDRRCCGIGGQGAVFTGTAREPTNGPQVIMREEKPLLEPSAQRSERAAVKVWNSTTTSALRSEVGFLQRMRGHPNISSLLGVFCELGDESMGQRTQWVTVVELCPGGDLFDLVSDVAIQQENAMQIMVGLFSALVYLHFNKIVHRDVKAENVVLHGERAVLIDFGIACRTDDVEGMKKRVGSPGYCAPEIVMGREYNEKVDIFAAGVLLYFMLRGRLPFSGESHSAVLEKTARCEVSFSATSFGEVSKGIIDIMKVTINPDLSVRPSALECFNKIYAMASREVRTSEAFRIAKLGLVGLTEECPSPAAAHVSTTTTNCTETYVAELENSTDVRREEPVRPVRSSSGTVWQLLQSVQELPAAAMRRLRKLSGSGSFTAVRICNMDLPKVRLSGFGTPEMSPAHNEFSSIAEGQSDTLHLPPVVETEPQPPPVARTLPVPKHRQRFSCRLSIPPKAFKRQTTG